MYNWKRAPNYWLSQTAVSYLFGEHPGINRELHCWAEEILAEGRVMAAALPAGFGQSPSQPLPCRGAGPGAAIRAVQVCSLMLPSLLTQPPAIWLFRASQVFWSLISPVCFQRNPCSEGKPGCHRQRLLLVSLPPPLFKLANLSCQAFSWKQWELWSFNVSQTVVCHINKSFTFQKMIVSITVTGWKTPLIVN